MPNLFLFSDNQNDTATNMGNYRLYDMKIEDNGELLRDFQPVLDSNNIPCLLDTINRKYYYNQGTGQFKTDEHYEYDRISYIQGDGTSWLNLNIIPDTSTKVVVDAYMELTDCYNGIPLFASRDTFLSYSFQTNAKWLYVGKLGNKQSVGDNTLANEVLAGRHTITIDLSDTTNVVNVDGVNYGTNTGTTTTCTVPILIFNDYDGWGSNRSENLSTAKIYSFKIYKSDELIFDGMPVLDSENTPCLYDRINGTLFYNQGTGTLAYGIEESEAPPCNQVDYIYREYQKNQDYFRTKNLNGLVDENLIIKAKIKLGTKTQNNAIFQIVGQYNINRTAVAYNSSSNQLETCFLGNNCYVSLDDYEVLNDDILEIQLSKDGLYVNNTFISELSTTNFDASFVIPLYIFQMGEYNDTIIGNSTTGTTIYYITFEQDGEAVANFLPALDDEGVLCFYESVDGIYYYATLGETFAYNNKLYSLINYIESDGTQYINTGVEITDNIDIDMVCRATSETPLYMMNGLTVNTTYKYNSVDTTVQPNLTASEGATLTLGTTNLGYLTEQEIEDATNNGWNLL